MSAKRPGGGKGGVKIQSEGLQSLIDEVNQKAQEKKAHSSPRRRPEGSHPIKPSELGLPDDFDFKTFLKSVDGVFARHNITRESLADIESKHGSDIDDEESPHDAIIRQTAAILYKEDDYVRTPADVEVLLSCFGDMPYFARLSKNQRVHVCRFLKLQTFKAGERIYERGDIADRVFLVYSGEVSIESIVRTIADRRKSRDDGDAPSISRPVSGSVYDGSDVGSPRVEEFSSSENLVGRGKLKGGVGQPGDPRPRDDSAEGPGFSNAAVERRHLASRAAEDDAKFSVSVNSSGDLRAQPRSARAVTDDPRANAKPQRSKTFASASESEMPPLKLTSPSSQSINSSSHKTWREVCRLRSGDVFGERAVTECGLRDTAVTAVEDTECLTIDKWTYHEYIRNVSQRVLGKVRNAYFKAGLPDGPPDRSYMDEAGGFKPRRFGSSRRFFSFMRRSSQKDQSFRMQSPVDMANLTVEEKKAMDKKKREIETKYLTPFYIQRNITTSNRVYKASQFIDDAIHGRAIRPHRTGYWSQRLDSFFNSTIFEVFMFCVVMLNLWIVGWEAPSFHDQQNEKYRHRFSTLISIEWFCWSCYAAELLWIMYDLGLHWFFGSRKRVFRLLLVLAIMADLIVATVLTAPETGVPNTYLWFRFSRVLRPFLLLYRLRYMRRMYLIAVKLVPRLLELWAIIAGIMVFFAVIGLYLFHEHAQLYEFEAWEAHPKAHHPYERCNIDGKNECFKLEEGYFAPFLHTVPNLMATLYIAMIGPNYPFIMYPAYVVSHAYQTYFIAFIMMTKFFCLQLLIAVIMDTYREMQAKFLQADEDVERAALSSAFGVLDVHDCGLVTYDIFRLLIHKKKPELKEYQIRALFAIMDKDGDGVVDPTEFMAIVDALFIRITKKRGARKNSKGDERRFAMAFYAYVAKIEALLTSRSWEFLYVCVAIADTACIISFSTTTSEGPRDLSAIFTLFFLTDVVMSIYCMGWAKFSSNSWKVFDMVIVIVQILGIAADSFDAFGDNSIWTLLRYFGMLRFIKVIAFVAGLEIFKTEEHIITTLTGTIVRMIPVFLLVAFALLTVVFYIFAVIGMEVFHGKGHEVGEDRCNDAKYTTNDPYARFCDAPISMLSLFQVLCDGAWHEMMYAAVEEEGRPAAWYFIIFHWMTTITMVNLLVAVFLDIFLSERAHQVTEAQLSDMIKKENQDEVSLDAGTQQNQRQLAEEPEDRVHNNDDNNSNPDARRMKSTSRATALLDVEHAEELVVAVGHSMQQVHRRLKKNRYGPESGGAPGAHGAHEEEREFDSEKLKPFRNFKPSPAAVAAAAAVAVIAPRK